VCVRCSIRKVADLFSQQTGDGGDWGGGDGGKFYRVLMARSLTLLSNRW